MITWFTHKLGFAWWWLSPSTWGIPQANEVLTFCFIKQTLLLQTHTHSHNSWKLFKDSSALQLLQILRVRFTRLLQIILFYEGKKLWEAQVCHCWATLLRLKLLWDLTSYLVKKKKNALLLRAHQQHFQVPEALDHPKEYRQVLAFCVVSIASKQILEFYSFPFALSHWKRYCLRLLLYTQVLKVLPALAVHSTFSLWISALGCTHPSDQRAVLCCGKRLSIAGRNGREIAFQLSLSSNGAKILKALRNYLLTSLLHCLSIQVH